jgi:hypothetical protein
MNEFIKINIYEKIENRKTFFLPYFHRSLDDYKKTFEKFFIEHGFKLIDSQAVGNSGQFLFKKK